jgi:hypothetical protein
MSTGDFDDFTRRVWVDVEPFTLTSPERVASLVEAVRYVIRYDIPGAFAECGVWRGGSALAALLTLVELGVTDRDIWLYDTFEAMPDPGPRDYDMYGISAAEYFARIPTEGIPEAYAFHPFADVRKRLLATGYPAERIHFVQGLIEQTIPEQAPAQIAILRLDTDWYESTAHELEHLMPRVPDGGVLIVDDYGHWVGAREAFDEYLEREKVPMFLHRIDYSGRIAIVRRAT